MSRFHQTWFSHSPCVLIIILIFFLFNLYFIIFGYSYKENGTISIQPKQFTIYPRWDYVNLDVYNCVPFLLMIIFNSGLIYHLFRLHHTNIILNSCIKHRSISITLLITIFLFLIMTVLATIGFATANVTLPQFLDGFLYSYHILSFPLYFITYGKGRGRIRPTIGPLVFLLANPIEFYINLKSKLRRTF
jgi:hypothetical protein